MSVLEELMKDYNHYLQRYYNGCDYLSKNPIETDKWLPELLKILNIANETLKEIKKHRELTDDEILYGFKIKEMNKATVRK